MKKQNLKGGILIAFIAVLFGFNTSTQSTISGKVSPADGAESVWAISSTDSVKGVINTGAFTVQVKAGIYKVIVEARDPYKDVLLDNVTVKDGQPADVGEIVLQK